MAWSGWVDPCEAGSLDALISPSVASIADVNRVHRLRLAAVADSQAGPGQPSCGFRAGWGSLRSGLRAVSGGQVAPEQDRPVVV